MNVSLSGFRKRASYWLTGQSVVASGAMVGIETSTAAAHTAHTQR